MRWTTVNGGGKVSVLNFFAAGTVSDQRAALETLLDGVCLSLDDTTSYVVETSGREFEDTTGTLTGSWADATARTGQGAATNEPVADATQMLIRWYTPSIINGRFLQGRTYIPGVAAGNLQGGNLNPTSQAGLQVYVDAFIATPAELVVWSRPTGSRPGSSDTVTTGAIWNEFAVLRRRRN